MIPSEQIILAIIASVGTALAGFYALFKFILGRITHIQDSFIDYIEKKNGHMERTSQLFSKEMAATTEMFGKKFDKLADILLDIKHGK